MMGNGPPQTPGAVLRAWRLRAGLTRDELARCIVSHADPASLLARKFSGPMGERDLAAAIGEYEDFDTWSRSGALVGPFMDACVDCLAGGRASLLDRATLAMALSQCRLPSEVDEDPLDAEWEEDDD